jgi:hypothetical protein
LGDAALSGKLTGEQLVLVSGIDSYCNGTCRIPARLTCENAARRNYAPRRTIRADWMRTTDGVLMHADVIETADARQLFS